MNVDTALDILTLEEAVKILKRPVPHTGMLAHDGYALHSHEVRPDHGGVENLVIPLPDPNENAIRWLTDVIGWMKTEEA